jgi:hypothetical protein
MIQVCLRRTTASASLKEERAEVEERCPEHRNGERQNPHQTGVGEIDPIRSRRRLVKIDKSNTH